MDLRGRRDSRCIDGSSEGPACWLTFVLEREEDVCSSSSPSHSSRIGPVVSKQGAIYVSLCRPGLESGNVNTNRPKRNLHIVLEQSKSIQM